MTPVWMHPSAGFEHQAKVRDEARRTNVIPPACHYLSTHQAELWRHVHEAHSPAFGEDETRSLYRSFFQQTTPFFAGNSHVVALGCGGSHKDMDLLQVMTEDGNPALRFTPQDVSPSLALMSAQQARQLDPRWRPTAIQPVVGDLLAMSDLAAWLASNEQEPARLITAFGLLPNFEPEVFLPWLKALLRPQDVLLLSANLAPVPSKEDRPEKREAYITATKKILPQYDNDETRTWLLRVLYEWGWEDEMNLERYKMRPVQRGGLLCCEASAVWQNSGERLELFRSYRYTPGRLQELLASHGFKIGPGEIAPNREEGVWLVQRAET